MEELIHFSREHKSIRDQIARNPLMAFVALAYMITWITWPLSNRFDLGTVNGFGIISLAGPALAATLVSPILRPEPSGVPAGKRWRLFGMIAILAVVVMVVVLRKA